MNTKYFVTLIATLLVSLMSFGADKLCVIFPETTNLVFTVPIIKNTGERPYDAFLEFPKEYENGIPTKFERSGLGYYIHVEVIEESEDGIRCKLKVDHHSLTDWIPYTLEDQIIFQPVLSALASETELILPIGEWYALDCTGLKGKQPLSIKFQFKRDEESQQLRD